MSEYCKHEDKSQKLDYSLLDPECIDGMVRALMYGSGKYGRHNYRKGGPYLEYLSSALRHIMAWRMGEEFDQESGCHHLGHAMCNLSFLYSWYVKGIGNDDRK